MLWATLLAFYPSGLEPPGTVQSYGLQPPECVRFVCVGMRRAGTAIRAMVMSVKTRWAVALFAAIVLLVVPVASLYCQVRDAAAMACCRGDMAGCNQPGKTEDCCRKNPTSHETTLNLVQAGRLDRPAAVSLPDFAVPAATPVTAALRPWALLDVFHLAARAAPSPPLTSVLRL